MWKIDLPEQGNVDAQLHAALVHKNGDVVHALTDEERTAIHALYAAYDALLGEPDASLNPDALAACANAIHDSYSQVQLGGRLAELRGKLLSRVVECPLCGIAPGPTLDHFLPKNNYRALAIYARNLVPACQPCNRAKGTLEPAAGQGMIHPYFQPLPEETFFHADVDYRDGTLIARFRIDGNNVDAALLERLRFQLDRLKLNERYPDPVNIFLFSLKPAFMLLRGGDNEREDLRAFLTKSAESYDGDMRLNHWRAALMRGLAACEDFLDDPWTYFARPLLIVDA